MLIRVERHNPPKRTLYVPINSIMFIEDYDHYMKICFNNGYEPLVIDKLYDYELPLAHNPD